MEGQPPRARRVRVRQATPADLDEVVTLRMALLRASKHNPLYARLRSDVRRRARELCQLQLLSGQLDHEGEAEVLFLAEYVYTTGHTEPIGVLRCAEVHGSPLTYPAAHGYLSSAYVIPAARRQRVLQAMVRRALKWCEARELTEVRLHCGVDNVPANAAWNALGFDVVEHLRVRSIARP